MLMVSHGGQIYQVLSLFFLIGKQEMHKTHQNECTKVHRTYTTAATAKR